MKPDIVDIRLDRLRADLDRVGENLAVVSELLARLSAQAAEQNAVLTRMCHGHPTDLPEDAILEVCMHGKGWTIQEMGDPYAAKANYWWVAYGAPPHGGNRQGEASSIPDAMDKIRKAHAELGVTL